MGNVIKADWSWKPDDKSYSYATYGIKRKKIIAAKKKRRAELKQKKADKAARNIELRDSLLRHFGLHKFTSWIAIADMVATETGCDIANTGKTAKKIALAYARKMGDPVRQYQPRQSASQFYASTKWKELRYIALKNSGGCCTLCGARSFDGVTLHVDHIVPRSVDPRKEYNLDNLQILCDDCNIGKSNRDCIDWRNK